MTSGATKYEKCHEGVTDIIKFGKGTILSLGSKYQFESLIDRGEKFDLLFALNDSVIEGTRARVLGKGVEELLPGLVPILPSSGVAVPTIAINWPDYGVPDLGREFWLTLVADLSKMEKKKVGVYCAAGHGRTGSFGAILVALSGIEKSKPVAWLRKKYCEDIVETKAQTVYVAEMGGGDVEEVREKSVTVYSGYGSGYGQGYGNYAGAYNDDYEYQYDAEKRTYVKKKKDEPKGLISKVSSIKEHRKGESRVWASKDGEAIEEETPLTVDEIDRTTKSLKELWFQLEDELGVEPDDILETLIDWVEQTGFEKDAKEFVAQGVKMLVLDDQKEEKAKKTLLELKSEKFDEKGYSEQDLVDKLLENGGCGYD